MDRISDSGSDDLGSNPGGITKCTVPQCIFHFHKSLINQKAFHKYNIQFYHQ